MPIVADNTHIYTVLGITTPTTLQIDTVTLARTQVEGLVKKRLRYDPVQATRTEYYPQMQLNSSGDGVWEVSDTEAYFRRVSSAASDELQLRHIPVRSITALYIDYGARFGTVAGSFAASTLKVEGTDYWANYDRNDSAALRFCGDGIVRSFGQWPSEPGSVRVAYVAGYTAAELAGTDSIIDASPIYYAVIEEAARYARRMLSSRSVLAGVVAGPLTSERLGDYSYSADTSGGSAAGGWELSGETIQRLAEFINYGYDLAS